MVLEKNKSTSETVKKKFVSLAVTLHTAKVMGKGVLNFKRKSTVLMDIQGKAEHRNQKYCSVIH